MACLLREAGACLNIDNHTSLPPFQVESLPLLEEDLQGRGGWDFSSADRRHAAGLWRLVTFTHPHPDCSCTSSSFETPGHPILSSGSTSTPTAPGFCLDAVLLCDRISLGSVAFLPHFALCFLVRCAVFLCAQLNHLTALPQPLYLRWRAPIVAAL